jgi:hypothetical protein
MPFEGLHGAMVDPFPGLLRDRKAARAAGHKTYFNGNRCLKRHQSPRRVSDGACCECLRLEKAKRDAAYLRGLARGRAPEQARKAAEREAKAAAREAERDERRRVREEAQKERQRLARAAKVAATREAKSATKEVTAGAPEEGLEKAPWD